MDKNQIKEFLKPLIKEVIKENLKDVIFETGFLSKLITEVVSGLNQGNQVIIKETKQTSKPKFIQQDDELKQERLKERDERMKKIMESTGMSKVFDNLEPLNETNDVLSNQTAKSSPETFSAAANKSGTALRDISPNDPGVNINGLLKLVGGSGTWKKQLK